jgi:hypothetical protein
MDVAAAAVSASKKFFKSQLSLSVPMSCRTGMVVGDLFVRWDGQISDST